MDIFLEFVLRYRYLVVLLFLLHWCHPLFTSTEKPKLTFGLNLGVTKFTIAAEVFESESIDDTLEQTAHIQEFLVRLRKPSPINLITRPNQAYFGGAKRRSSLCNL